MNTPRPEPKSQPGKTDQNPTVKTRGQAGSELPPIQNDPAVGSDPSTLEDGVQSPMRTEKKIKPMP